MCGRIAQTGNLAEAAARNFGIPADSRSIHCDNFNSSPGVDCSVISLNEKSGGLEASQKKWGLISKSGTAKQPLYTNEKEIIKICFQNLCYNARCETLYSKFTFSRLALQGKTCVVALDGYFEWKPHPYFKRKQPYFVYRKQQDMDDDKSRQRQPLLIAGLYTKVSTGNSNSPDLHSFTMLTTEASKQIEWLHHRMPVCIWDIDLAKRWMTQPSEALKKQIDDAARLNNNGFAWHKVSPEVSNLKFQGEEVIKEMKETTQSVTNFFATTTAKTKQEGTKNLLAFEKNSTNKMKSSSDVDKNSDGVVTTITSSSTTTGDRKRPPTSIAVNSSPNKKNGLSKMRVSVNTNSSSTSKNNQNSISYFFQEKK
jgi:putative SOS response-associated peptidase YedK